MKLFPFRHFFLFVFSIVTLLSTPVSSQDSSANSEPACSSASIVSIPSRPTVTSATDTTQCGTVEAEYGAEKQWIGAGSNREDVTGGFRLGLTPNLDLHWSSGDYLNLSAQGSSQSGFGDTWLGLRYRFLNQTENRPSLGVFYQVKVPTAAFGLGSGQTDHSIAFLVSKDVRAFHFDFNAIPTFVGQPGGGFDHNVGFALATWHPVSKRLTLVAEPYGYTELNPATPAFASLMVGGNYKITPRLYLDSGIDAGITYAAPQRRVFVGATYAMANLYSWMRPGR
jgi:hypothetical protein